MSDFFKAVFKPQTGQTDNYFGQHEDPNRPGEPGLGKGHIRVNEQGDPSILRGEYNPGEPFARRNATELDSRGPLNPINFDPTKNR